MPQNPVSFSARMAAFFGINRGTLSLLVAIGGLGLSEEVWRGFFGPYLKQLTTSLGDAVLYMGVFSSISLLIESAAFFIGGNVAHGMGPRRALLVSALPVVMGFSLFMLSSHPVLVVAGALLISHWEPLSTPAAFDVVGTTVAENRRTIAFSVQSIFKRLPRVLGPLLGIALFAVHFRWNVAVSVALVVGTGVLIWRLAPDLRPKTPTDPEARLRQVSVREVLGAMPKDLKRLLTAEILIRWSDWFVRDFAGLYVIGVLLRSEAEWGQLLALQSAVALATYIPVGKWVDASRNVKPFVGLTFFFFALFPLALIFLPELCQNMGLPVGLGLGLAFVLNGLREIGEPARKALITTSLPPEIRARAVGVYWGLRSAAFCVAPILSALLWRSEWIGPQGTFLLAGALGLCACVWFGVGVRLDGKKFARHH